MFINFMGCLWCKQLNPNSISYLNNKNKKTRIKSDLTNLVHFTHQLWMKLYTNHNVVGWTTLQGNWKFNNDNVLLHCVYIHRTLIKMFNYCCEYFIYIFIKCLNIYIIIGKLSKFENYCSGCNSQNIYIFF